jgi:EmrB/QacA subfamily drug resistance transporter
MTSNPAGSARTAASGASAVLLLLASAQFLMILDSSVMNVSIAAVAEDVGTTVTGIQTAITLYTLVMASLMVTGGKVGAMIGHRRAFAIGIVIYASGSFVTAIAPSLPVLIIGWSFLEGIGAALIMPALVALVAANFPPDRRTAAYGALAAAAALAVAAGPLIGGAVTTLLTWRLVFLGEVVVAFVILVFARRLKDKPVEPQPPFDLVGALLSIVGLAAFVLGILKTGEWGWVRPEPGMPQILGLSPALWLILGGLLVLWLLTRYESRLEAAGREPLIRPTLFRVPQLTGGLALFLGQYFIQGGFFFVTPLFLSVVLELSAFQTGLRLVPLSVALFITALGLPRFLPRVSPRRIVQLGLLLAAAGVMVLISGLDIDADASVVTIPMVLIGIGLGALASQLGAVTVSALPDSRSSEVGGLQNTSSNLGISLGTALVGSVLIGTLSAAFVTGILESPTIPDEVKEQTQVSLVGDIPFVSATQLEAALSETDLPPETVDEILATNRAAQIEALRFALAFVALAAILALFATPRVPDKPIGSAASEEAPPGERATAAA